MSSVAVNSVYSLIVSITLEQIPLAFICDSGNISSRVLAGLLLCQRTCGGTYFTGHTLSALADELGRISAYKSSGLKAKILETTLNIK